MRVATRRISKLFFWFKLRNVKDNERYQIKNYIFHNRPYIDHYEYGHIPGKRVFKIILKNGKEKVWNLRRMR